MAAAGGAGRAAAAAAAMHNEVIDISDSDRRRLVLYPLYRVDIIKDSIDFGGITSLAARQKVRFIVNTLFKPQEMRYNLLNYGISNTILKPYAELLTENTHIGEWRRAQYQLVDNELQTFAQRPILYPTCHLGYFQDRAPSAHIVVPALYNNEPLAEFEEYHVNFGIHDSGKAPKFFDRGIRQVQTPGSFIDPASRSPADIVHMSGLDSEDFRNMGLAHLFDTLTVTEPHGGDIKYKVKLSLNSSDKFIFKFTDNVNKPAPKSQKNNNNLLKGNRVKNEYINRDDSTPETNMNYMLVKLLGDLLQVYYGRKLIIDGTYNKNEICIFTSDNNVKRLAQIFQVPCLTQDREHKLQGSERSYYTYYAYKDGIDPNGDPITSHMRINKLECTKIIKHNAGVIQTFTDCLNAGEIYVGVKQFRPIPHRVIEYMTRARTGINKVNDTLKSIDTADINVYRTTVSLQMDPLKFKKIINKYRAIDVVRFTDVGAGIRAYSALTTRLIFPLVGPTNSVNIFINGQKGAFASGEFRHFVYGSSVRVRDMRPEEAGAAAEGGAPSPDLLERAFDWLKNVTSIDGIIRGIRSAFGSVFRGGGGKKGTGAAAAVAATASGANNIPTNIYSKILDETPYDELINIITNAIHTAILRIDPKPDIFIEDVLALIYPYFALRGQFTINPEFYKWFIRYISRADFFGYINTGEVDVAYDHIHSPPAAPAPAPAAGGAGAASVANDSNGRIFSPDRGKRDPRNDKGIAGAAAAPAAADDADLYNSVPSVLDGWQGNIDTRNPMKKPNRPTGYDNGMAAAATINEEGTDEEGAGGAGASPLRAKAAPAKAAAAAAAAIDEEGAGGAGATPPRVKAVPAKAVPVKAVPVKAAIDEEGAGAPGGGGGGGGGGDGSINVEHGGGARIRKTRKKRVNTLKRKLRKFRDTGRI